MINCPEKKKKIEFLKTGLKEGSNFPLHINSRHILMFIQKKIGFLLTLIEFCRGLLILAMQVKRRMSLN